MSTAVPAAARRPRESAVRPGQKQDAAGTSAPITGRPSIHFTETQHSYGTVAEGDTVEHAFTFENRGTGVLVISGVKASCDCTAAAVSAHRVAPGKQGRVRASFRTRGYKGSQSSQIYVDSNDPQRRRVALTLTGYVERDIDADSDYVYFGDVAADAVSSRTVRVASAKGTPFRITRVSTTSPVIRVSEARRSKQGGYELDVSVGPDLPPGRISGNLVIETDSRRQPRLELRVLGNVGPATEASE